MQSALSSTIRHFNTSVYTHLSIGITKLRTTILRIPNCLLDNRGFVHSPIRRHYDENTIISLGFAYSPKWDEDVTLNVIFSHIHGGSACQCRGKKESIDEIHHGD